MGTLCSPFYYDFVIAINEEKNLNQVLSAFGKKQVGKKLLGVTYNHRGFNIHEKNYIKALIDHFSFDHMMFSIRPSASLLISQNLEDISKFRQLTQVIFVLQVMARYEIANGFVSSRYLGFHDKTSVDATVVAYKLIKWIDDLLKDLKKATEKNVVKHFCS